MTAWISGDMAAYVTLIVAAVIPNGVWRWVAVFATAGLDDKSPVFTWVRHVATCLVAGVVAQLMLAPPGALAAAPIWLRFAALGLAAATWAITRRSVLLGWIAGVASLTVAMAMA
jgi:hypothetical protein